MSQLADTIVDENPHRHLTLVEGRLWALSRPIGIPAYDLDLERFFACRHPTYLPDEVVAVARLGAFADYDTVYRQLGEHGIRLVNSPEEHRRVDDLRVYAGLLEGLTPKSLWFDAEPDLEQIGDELGYPVFVKGARQTSLHRKRLSVARDEGELRALLDEARRDPMLGAQPLVFRRHVKLRLLASSEASPPPERLPGAYELRTFWFGGKLVGAGPYWWQDERYDIEGLARVEALSLAREASRRVAVPFVVVDVAMTAEGGFVVIECNDGQESGYAGVSGIAVWKAMTEACG